VFSAVVTKRFDIIDILISTSDGFRRCSLRYPLLLLLLLLLLLPPLLDCW